MTDWMKHCHRQKRSECQGAIEHKLGTSEYVYWCVNSVRCWMDEPCQCEGQKMEFQISTKKFISIEDWAKK